LILRHFWRPILRHECRKKGESLGYYLIGMEATAEYAARAVPMKHLPVALRPELAEGGEYFDESHFVVFVSFECGYSGRLWTMRPAC